MNSYDAFKDQREFREIHIETEMSIMGVQHGFWVCIFITVNALVTKWYQELIIVLFP